MVRTKECNKCKEELPETEFHKHSRKRDGLQPFCKACNKESNNNSRRGQDAKRRVNVSVDLGVYGIKEGDEFVYIGSAEDLPWRLYQHKMCNRSFDDGLNKLQREVRYRWHVLWHGESLDDARHQEKVLIQLHEPKFNKIKYKSYNG